MAGLPGAAVKESLERVESAVVDSGLTVPVGRIAINLTAADQPKLGS
ncbi:MAG: magnesium chelatase domain-containing protein [Planctomycetota bacterium]